MKKLFIFNWMPIFFAVMATFSFSACGGSDGDDNGIPGIGGNATAPATIIGKWKLMTIDNAGNPTGTWEIYCFNADGTAYSQELDANGTPIDKHNYTYTYENGTICTYKENGRLQDMLLNVVVTATTLTATSPNGFTATMIRVYDDDNNTDSGDDDNNDNGNGGNDNGDDDNDDNTTITPGTPSVTVGTAIDLGLSVKWASCNVGATTPEEYGGYYAWGETEEKSYYEWDTYKYCNGSYTSITKYCTNSYYGTVDNKTTLEPCDDVASVKWGGNWRMPTRAEQDELRNSCTWEWTTLDGVKGYRVTGPNGNSIFLPAAGYRHGTGVSFRGSDGNFWSSSFDSIYCFDACYLYWYDSGNSIWYSYGHRCVGHSVRPVCP